MERSWFVGLLRQRLCIGRLGTRHRLVAGHPVVWVFLRVWSSDLSWRDNGGVRIAFPDRFSRDHVAPKIRPGPGEPDGSVPLPRRRLLPSSTARKRRSGSGG